jgi:5'-deoxynucleotidase YfbR-like HD superfamily hydrolase
MNNTFLELVNIPALNTDNAIRYSLMYQIKEESLADHIADVGVLSYLLTLRFNSYGENLNVGDVLEKVLLHDLDEVLTGDIPRSTKYYSDAGLNAMRGVALDAITKLAEGLPGSEGLVEKWKSAKQGKEGSVLVLSDMLCVARKVVTEVKILGNGYFLKVAYEMIDNLTELKKELESGELSKFNEDSRAYINQLIHDAIGVMEELTCGDDRLTRYGVINNVFSKPAE